MATTPSQVVAGSSMAEPGSYGATDDNDDDEEDNEDDDEDKNTKRQRLFPAREHSTLP